MSTAERLLPPPGSLIGKRKESESITDWISGVEQAHKLKIHFKPRQRDAKHQVNAKFTKQAGKKLAQRKPLTATCDSELAAMEVRQTRSQIPCFSFVFADFLSFQRLVSWIQEQLDPKRIARGRKSESAVPLLPDPVLQVTKRRGTLTTWLGATPPILAPPATNSAAPKAATGSAKRTAKRAVDITTNNGCRNVEGQVQVLRQQLRDPAIRPILMDCLPGDITTKVNMVSSAADLVARTKHRGRPTTDERLIRDGVALSMVSAGDTTADLRQKAKR